MDKISSVVEELVLEDDDILMLGSQNVVNWSSYARKIQPRVEAILGKEARLGSIVTALTRYFQNIPDRESFNSNDQLIERLSIHSNLEGITFERSAESSFQIQKEYQNLSLNPNSFVTVTQGINEITLVGESQYIHQFRTSLASLKKIYDKKNLVGISIKFQLKYLEIPKVLFQFHRSLAQKKINIIEIISTATELTFIIEKKDLQKAIESLQRKLY